MDQNLIDNLNETKLRKLLINFERKFNENQKLRIKHSESPTKYASSEIELFASLDELQGIVTQPELYHILIAKNTLATLLGLLAHENSDISAKIISILQDLTDIDEESESTRSLIKALLEQNIINLIVTNLSRFDTNTKEECQAISNSLEVIDSLIDFDNEIVSTFNPEPLINWMIKQLSASLEFNPIKLSITELLSIILLNSEESKPLLSESGCIDALLQQVAYYKRVAPVTGDEHEFLEQAIDCLCTGILNCEPNHKCFLDEEGIDLIVLLLREKHEAVRKSNIKLSTLKLLNHVLTTDENQNATVTKCCERFVDVLGLRVIFPIFDNPKLLLNTKIKRREYQQVLTEVEEHSSAILLALLKHSQRSDCVQRILIKFAEGEFKRLKRAFGLHEKYFGFVLKNQQDKSDEGESDEDNAKADRRKVDTVKSGALFTLRTVDYLILLACYLSQHFEIYDPIGGETFANFIGNLLSCRPELRHQIVVETQRHICEVSDSSEEKNSLELLMKHFEQLSKVINK